MLSIVARLGGCFDSPEKYWECNQELSVRVESW